MKIVCISAGLANQMFMYAFACYLKHKGLNVRVALQARKPLKEYSFENITLKDVFHNIEMRQAPLMIRPFIKLVFKQSKKAQIAKSILSLFGVNYIYEPKFAFTPEMEKRASWFCIYKGFWQSELYFKECADYIRKQFVFPEFQESENIKYADIMTKENSIAIHIRKGKDYLTHDLYGGGKICDINYYISAINYIKNHVENPQFYVFTDNPSWIKENLPDFDYTLVNWNEVSGKTQFRDMQLMTCCKHNIIANSTYSWWGAWLNPNPSKIVIAPKEWINHSIKSSGDWITNDNFFSTDNVVCESWIKM